MHLQTETSVDQVDKLPTELWARVFLLLGPAREFVKWINEFGNSRAGDANIADAIEEQARFHMLKLVCRKFSRVFEEHLPLSSFLFLAGQGVSSYKVFPTLMTWLRCHSGSMSELGANCEYPIVEVSLGTLSCTSAPLSIVSVISPDTVPCTLYQRAQRYSLVA